MVTASLLYNTKAFTPWGPIVFQKTEDLNRKSPSTWWSNKVADLKLLNHLLTDGHGFELHYKPLPFMLESWQFPVKRGTLVLIHHWNICEVNSLSNMNLTFGGITLILT